jgi:hypothetical protein
MRTASWARMLTATLLAAAAGSAEAQVTQRRSGNQPPPPPTYTRVIPPEPIRGSTGLLERDFMYMRATSPSPNNFLYGRWNPRYETYTSPLPYPGGHYGGGYYGGGYYGGYYPGYYGNVYGGGYFYGTPYGSTVQREVIILRDGGYSQPQAPAQPQPQPPATQPAAPRQPGDDFYLRGSERPAEGDSVSAALDDLRKAWLNGDFERFQSRLSTTAKIRIFPKGQFRYAVDGKEFAAMIQDAMTRIDTLALEFDRPRSDDKGRALVTGKHTFVDSDKSKQTTYISYVLEKVAGRWKIVEAGSSTTPITGHTEGPAPAPPQ